MARQRMLDFRREGLETLWNRLPAQGRRDVITLYARLLVRAAQRRRLGPQEGGAAR